MPDRLPSLVLLVGFWIPPGVVGYVAADFVHRSTTRVRPALIKTLLTAFVLAWTAVWSLINLNAIPPYLPGETHDPTYAPPGGRCRTGGRDERTRAADQRDRLRVGVSQPTTVAHTHVCCEYVGLIPND
jgi:hypothetical protein